MFVMNLINSISKLVERGMCDHVTDENLNESIYRSALELGIQGYKNYAQAAEILGIKTNYLYQIVSKYNNEIGDPFHNPILGKNNLLSTYQIRKIEIILNA